MWRPGAPSLKVSSRAEDVAPATRRAARPAGESEEPRVGGASAPNADDMAARARLGRGARAARTVAMSRLRTATPPGSSPEKDLGLGVGDLLERAEIFEMHRRDRGDDRDMRAAPSRPAARSRRRGSCRSRTRRSARVAGSGRATAARPNDCCRTRPRRGSAPASPARPCAAPPWSWSCRPSR